MKSNKSGYSRAFNLPRIESRALKYGYSNARVRAMKGLLLKPAFLDELIKVRTVSAMVELLERTGYKEDLVALSLGRRDSSLVEIAAARNFMRVSSKLKRMAPGEDRKTVESLLVRWDLLNLKVLINGLKAGKKFEDLKSYLFAIGRLSEKDFELLAHSQDFISDLKRTPVGKELAAVSEGLQAKTKFAINADTNAEAFLKLQSLLDSGIYSLMENSLSYGGSDTARIRRILKKEIDAKNIMIIQRMKTYSVPADRVRSYLVRGGSLGRSATEQLITAKDMSVAYRLLKQHFRNLELPENSSLVDVEVSLEKAIAAEKLAAFHRSILSIGVLLGFILLKEEELNNLRKIAKAKEFGMPEQEVRKMLVAV